MPYFPTLTYLKMMRSIVQCAVACTAMGQGSLALASEVIVPTHSLPVHATNVLAVAFSPDSERLITSSMDGMVRIWNVKSGKLIVSVSAHKDLIIDVTFNSDGDLFATASADGTARLWASGTGESVAVLTEHPAGVSRVQFSSDGVGFATAGQNDRTAKIWNFGSTRSSLTLRQESSIEDLQFDRTSERLVTIGYGEATIWDAKSGAVVAKLSGHNNWLSRVAYSADNSRIITTSYDKTARIWDATTGASQLVLAGHLESVYDCQFSRDGRYVVTGSTDRTAVVWDAFTGKSLKVLSGHSQFVSQVRFSHDGRRVITGSHDRSAKIWDTATGIEIATLARIAGAESRDRAPSMLAVSPDGRSVALASGQAVGLWDVSRLLAGR
jgi:WD40 repeat protein